MKKSTYRKSIWLFDDRYAFPHAKLIPEDFDTIARLSSVDAAKKRIPPIPILSLLEISRLAKTMPKSESATTSDIIRFLESGSIHHGAGIFTLICMLAVETGGDYPPMDRKFVTGLWAGGKLNDEQKEKLIKGKVNAFADVYIANVIPAWIETLLKPTSPQEADNYWGSKTELKT